MGNASETSVHRGVVPYPPITPRPAGKDGTNPPCLMTLELHDGSAYQGYAFGANKSISGELVFQTGKLQWPTEPYHTCGTLKLTTRRDGWISRVDHRSVISRTDSGHDFPACGELW